MNFWGEHVFYKRHMRGSYRDYLQKTKTFLQEIFFTRSI